MHDFSAKKTTYLLSLIFGITTLAACSTHHLRKFDEGDISKELSADVAKKFEIKEVSSAEPAPSPTPAPTPVKKTRNRKTKVIKKEEAPIAVATPTPFASPLRRTEAMPFEVGEKLAYDIRYVGVTAGTLNLEVQPVKQMDDHKVYQITALANTVKIFELVYRVDDRLDSFYDFDGLYSRRFTMDLDESKQTRKVLELYDYEKKKSFYWNRVNHVDRGQKEEKVSFDIALWSQDPISSLYYLRSAKLPTEPSTEFRFPVILDGKPWECALHFKKKEKLYAGGKDRLANVYTLSTYQNGEVKNKDNTIWISDDEHHYILRIEAKVKVGSFAVALDKIL